MVRLKRGDFKRGNVTAAPAKTRVRGSILSETDAAE
jgi:hypothetical protein